MNFDSRELYSLFENQAGVSGEHAFVSYKNIEYSYHWFMNESSNFIEKMQLEGRNLRVGIVIDKTNPYLYLSIIACWKLGHTIVPINKDDLENNVKKAIDIARVTVLLTDENLSDIDQRLTLSASYDNLYMYSRNRCLVVDMFDSGTAPAYILFTSGSTGQPKAVPIKTESLMAYVTGVQEMIPQLKERQVLSNFFEPTFDLFFHDLLCAWASGSTLVPLSRNKIFEIPTLVRERKVTAWFSVPSVIPILNSLTKDKSFFESVDVSLFCGEALTTSYANSWLEMTSTQELYNLYGPTEATIAATCFKYVRGEECESIVKVGKPLKEAEYCILDNGELCLHGKQVFDGYIGLDKSALISIDDKVFYKTGDLFSEDGDQNLIFMGRKDRQVKILGNRIELDYLQARTRESNLIDHIFISASTSTNEQLFDGVSIYYLDDQSQNITLPSEFSHIPIKSISRISSVPMNKNGKVAYANLAESVMEG